MADSPFNLIGRIVDGRYRVESIAGQGGQGVVYRAYHLTFESYIALKVLKIPTQLSPGERSAKVSNFRREGRVLFELSGLHASIVRAFEAGVVSLDDGAAFPYLALEWLDGSSLDRELRHRRRQGLRPFELGEILSLLNSAACALSLAHARGIAHRDLKPGNLFIAEQANRRVVKVLDFGIAKIIDASLRTTANLEQTTGAHCSFTPIYGAPEQWLRRLGATGPWTDVHALALVCVELLTGKLPFSGDEPAHFMAACLDASSRPTPRTFGLEVSDAVEATFARALALNPRERFPDIGQFWTALCSAANWFEAQAVEVSLHAPAATPVGEHASPAPLRGPRAAVTERTASRTNIDMASLVATKTRPARWQSVVGIAALSIGAFLASVHDTAASRPEQDSPLDHFVRSSANEDRSLTLPEVIASNLAVGERASAERGEVPAAALRAEPIDPHVPLTNGATKQRSTPTPNAPDPAPRRRVDPSKAPEPPPPLAHDEPAVESGASPAGVVQGGPRGNDSRRSLDELLANDEFVDRR